MSGVNDELILESIDNYNIGNNANSSSNNINLQKQLINYKLQQKVLSDLLRQLLNGDASDYEDGALNPQVLHSLLNQVIDCFASLLNGTETRAQMLEDRQVELNKGLEIGKSELKEKNENISIVKKEDGLNHNIKNVKKQLLDIREETNLMSKLQLLIKIINMITVEVHFEYQHVRNLVDSQSKRIDYLQYMFNKHSNESSELIAILSKRPEPSLSGNEELEKLKLEISTLQDSKVINDSINNKQLDVLDNKLQQTNQRLQQKDLIIHQLRQQLENQRLEDIIDTQSDDDTIAREVLKMHELNEQLEQITKKSIEEIKAGDKDIHVVSNFNGQNLLENNLVQTINVLNSKLVEKNAVLDKLNSAIIQLNAVNSGLLDDKLSLNKTLINSKNSYNALLNKNTYLGNSLDNSIDKFQILLSLDIRSYTKLTEAFTKIVDEDSLSQAREKLSKLITQHQRKKPLNYEKIVYLTEAIHHYFNSAVETLVNEHISLTIDSGVKQRSDLSIIHDLQVKTQHLSEENETLRAELAKASRELQKQQRSALLLDNVDSRTGSLVNAANPLSGADSPRSKARIEEMTKRLKSEREKRKADYKAWEKRLSELERENEYLRSNVSFN